MEQTTAKLRKTFRYPTDNDSDDSLPEAMDEEEQERLILDLNDQNAKVNLQYNRMLLALSLVTVLPYISSLFSPRTALLSLLSITSLLSTAYLLYSLPPERTSISFLDKLNGSDRAQSQVSRREALQQVVDGPIKQYLPYLNLVLSVVLALLGMVVSRRDSSLWWGFGWLPAGIYGIVLVSKWVMGSVDPEGELGGLKYGYKGA